MDNACHSGLLTGKTGFQFQRCGVVRSRIRALVASHRAAQDSDFLLGRRGDPHLPGSALFTENPWEALPRIG